MFDASEVDAFAEAYFARSQDQHVLYALLDGPLERFSELPRDEQAAFKTQLAAYVRLYAFLAQVATFIDADLEKRYQFARYLLLRLRTMGTPLPLEVQRAIDIESFRIQETSRGTLAIGQGRGQLKPQTGSGPSGSRMEDLEPLSEIIRELNERFGTTFEERDRVFVEELLDRLAEDPALEASVRANTPDNARLTFDQIVGDRLQDMVETNFEFYKRVTDDERFGKFFGDWLFDQYRQRVARTQPGPKPPAIVDAVVEALVRELHPRKVILFGSAARGDMGPESDLDVLVVLDEVEGWRDKMTRGYKAIVPLRVAVDLLVVSQREVDEWGHVVGHVINDALVDGRVLYDAA